MRRLIPAVGVASLWAASALFAQVLVDQEPHHKRLLYTNDIRVFDVTLAPGEATADHVHEHDVATLVIADGTVRITEQNGAPAAYRIQNTGTAGYRAIEVENMREDGKWLALMPLAAPGTSVLQQSRAFTIYDERLTAGMGEVRHVHTWSTILVLVEGAFENGGIGGEEPVRLTRGGQWLTFPRAQAHTVAAVGGDARIIEIEAR
jgi:hypothetical protein